MLLQESLGKGPLILRVGQLSGLMILLATINHALVPEATSPCCRNFDAQVEMNLVHLQETIPFPPKSRGASWCLVQTRELHYLSHIDMRLESVASPFQHTSQLHPALLLHPVARSRFFVSLGS